MRSKHLTLLVLLLLASSIPASFAAEEKPLSSAEIQALPQLQLENNVRYYYLKDDMQNLEVALQELERRVPDHQLVTLYRSLLKSRGAAAANTKKTSATTTAADDKLVLPDKPLNVSLPGVAGPAATAAAPQAAPGAQQATTAVPQGAPATTAEMPAPTPAQPTTTEVAKPSGGAASSFGLYAIIGVVALVVIFVVVKMRKPREDVFSGPLGDNTVQPQPNDFTSPLPDNGGMTQLPTGGAKSGMSLEDIRLHFGDTTPPIADEDDEDGLSGRVDDVAQITLLDTENNVDYNQVTLMDENDQLTLMDFSNQVTIADTGDAPAPQPAVEPPEDNLPLDLGLGGDNPKENPLDLFDAPPAKTTIPPAPPSAPDDLDALVSGMAEAQAQAPHDALFDASNEATIILEPDHKKKD